jgi:hypothetical protein
LTWFAQESQKLHMTIGKMGTELKKWKARVQTMTGETEYLEGKLKTERIKTKGLEALNKQLKTELDISRTHTPDTFRPTSAF